MIQIQDERGTTVFVLLVVAMLLTLGVLGADYSRAFAVQARIQTAADAATLAACTQAEIKGEHVEGMFDAYGNPTIDPNEAVKIISDWSTVWLDLSSREEQADNFSWSTFLKNITGGEGTGGEGSSPIKDVAIPQHGTTHVDKMSPGYSYVAGVDYTQSKTAPDGGIYHDTYAIQTLEVGVKSYLAHNLFRRINGQDIFESMSGGKWEDRTIPVSVQSSAQAVLAP